MSENKIFNKSDYENLAQYLSENEINNITKETRMYVQEEREGSKTEDKIM